MVYTGQIDLSGYYDLHIHTSPDVRPRELDDIAAARQALDSGMACIGLKSHVTMTADRAMLVQETLPGIRVVGGIVLNEQLGGINPSAVESALAMGAKVIWMPTISAQNHRKYHGEDGGIQLFTYGKAGSQLDTVLEQIAKSGAVLATGHISIDEIIKLVKRAGDIGVEKIVITHPEVPWIAMPVGVQEEMTKCGVFFERCFVSTSLIGGGVPVEKIIHDIRTVGVETTILSTDYGVKGCGMPIQGFRKYLSILIGAGFHSKEIHRMARENPALMVG